MPKITYVHDIRDNDHTTPMRESIIASAVWWYKKYSNSMPTYSIKLFIGKRHCHCFAHLKEAWANVWRVVWSEIIKGATEQWFLTSENRFVDRKEAMIIAKNFWQITKKVFNRKDKELYSEDLR